VTRLAARIVIPLAILLAPILALAAVLVPLSLEHLVQEADAVVLGEAVRAESFWGPRHERIYTDVTLRVERTIKGAPDVTEVTVRRLGGVVDGKGMKVPGAGTIAIGERHLLFLRRGEPERYVVMGMAQGIYRIRPPQIEDGPEIAARDLSGAALAQPLARQPAPDRLALPELLGRIEKLLRPAGTR